MATERLTSQKKIILDYLKSVRSHPSVEDIYQVARKKLPQISLGTVYRILNNLAERKIIQEIPSVISRYDADVSSHAHFICEKCDAIFDIFDVCRECSVLRRKKIKVGSIEKYNLYFYGICKKCKSK